MSEIVYDAQLELQMHDYRGLSAYQIAVKNGFEGSEAQWLESLKGRPGQDAENLTVNNKEAVDGNITVRGTDIYVEAGLSQTVAQALEKRVKTDDVVDSLESEDASRPLSAAQGKLLTRMIMPKAQAYAYAVTLAEDGWVQAGGVYEQKAEVMGVTADTRKTSVIASPPVDREREEMYVSCGVRASAQGNGTITFTCLELPEGALTVHVMVIISGGENA